jgi:putative transposase
MSSARSRYHGHRFPPEIIGCAIWVYRCSCVRFRDVKDLLSERGIIVSYLAIRTLVLEIQTRLCLKKKQGRLGDTWYLDELFIRINGQQQYLLLRSRRDQRAAERFLRRLLRSQGKQPFRIITDKLKSYAAAGRTILPGVTHDTQQSGGKFASAHSDERTTNAPIQITPTSSAFSITPRRRP